MRLIHKSLYFLSLSGLLTLLAFSCKNKNPDPVPAPANYNRSKLLNNVCDAYIVPAFGAYKNAAISLKVSVDSFASDKSVSNLLLVRSALENAIMTWQDVAFISFGPAENISLRSQTNIYPIDTAEIMSNASSGSYNLALPDNFDAKGFQALDFLFHLRGYSDAQTVDYYFTHQGAMNYALDVAAELKANAETVNNSWQTYKSTFKSNSTSNSQGSSMSDMVNAISLHYEAYIRKGKVGIPAGVFNGFSQLPMPGHVETAYGKKSLLHLNRAVESIYKFYKGISYNSGVDGEGLDDYLDFVKAEKSGTALSALIATKKGQIISKIGGLNEPFAGEVQNNSEAVKSLYNDMQTLAIYFKVDLASALGVLITYQDSDGD